MDLGALLLIIAVALAVGVYLWLPYSENRSRKLSQADHDFSALVAERERILRALQELEMDYLLGKVPEEDYPTHRAELLAAGVDVLKKLDALTGKADDASAESRLEAAIADRAAAAANGDADDDLEALIARRKAQRKAKPAGFCPQCGRPVQKTDRFCPSCGQAL